MILVVLIGSSIFSKGEAHVKRLLCVSGGHTWKFLAYPWHSQSQISLIQTLKGHIQMSILQIGGVNLF